MTDIVPAHEAKERSLVRRAELAAKLVKTEERVLGLVERGLTAAGVTLSSLTDPDDEGRMRNSPQSLLQAVKSVETLHKIAKEICGDSIPDGPRTVINVANISADAELVASVTKAYAEVESLHMERARAAIEEAERDGIIDGEIVVD